MATVKSYNASVNSKISSWTQIPNIAFCYDIPKNEGLTNKELTTYFRSMGIKCQAQIIIDDKKPFLSARIKFDSDDDLKVGLEKLRYFKIRNKCCRVLGFEPLLERNARNFDRAMKGGSTDPTKKIYE